MKAEQRLKRLQDKQREKANERSRALQDLKRVEKQLEVGVVAAKVIASLMV